MFLSLRLTAGRLLAIVTIAVCAILAFDAVKTAQADDSIVCATDFERAEYLKRAGVHVDSEPVWTKPFSFSGTPDKVTAQFLSALDAQGFDIYTHVGEELTVHCYQIVTDADKFARVVMCGDELVAADGFALGISDLSIPLGELAENVA